VDVAGVEASSTEPAWNFPRPRRVRRSRRGGGSRVPGRTFRRAARAAARPPLRCALSPAGAGQSSPRCQTPRSRCPSRCGRSAGARPGCRRTPGQPLRAAPGRVAGRHREPEWTEGPGASPSAPGSAPAEERSLAALAGFTLRGAWRRRSALGRRHHLQPRRASPGRRAEAPSAAPVRRHGDGAGRPALARAGEPSCAWRAGAGPGQRRPLLDGCRLFRTGRDADRARADLPTVELDRRPPRSRSPLHRLASAGRFRRPPSRRCLPRRWPRPASPGTTRSSRRRRPRPVLPPEPEPLEPAPRAGSGHLGGAGRGAPPPNSPDHGFFEMPAGGVASGPSSPPARCSPTSPRPRSPPSRGVARGSGQFDISPPGRARSGSRSAAAGDRAAGDAVILNVGLAPCSCWWWGPGLQLGHGGPGGQLGALAAPSAQALAPAEA
jgi:hypothetical protein